MTKRSPVYTFAVAATLLAVSSAPGAQQPPGLAPIDPQRVQDQDAMTWADYRPIPGTN